MSASGKGTARLIFQPFLNLKSFKKMVLLVLLELVIALPLSSMALIPGFTNLRPAAALIPLFGIFFGPTGSWAIAIGNLLYDTLSGNLAISCIGGFYSNWLAAFLWWLVAGKLNSEDGLMGSGKSMVVFVVTSVVVTVVIILGIAPWIGVFYSMDTAVAFAQSVFFVDNFFFIVPGMGLTIILEKAYGLKPFMPGAQEN